MIRNYTAGVWCVSIFRGIPLSEKSEIIHLTEQVKSGSQEAFSELVARYDPMIKSEIAFYLGFGAVSFDELYQEAMIALFAAATSFDKNYGSTFGSYTRVCVRHRFDSFVRKNAGTPFSEELSENLLFPGLSPEESLIADESYRLRMEFIDGMLTPYERSVFLLYLEGRSYREIAKKSGKSEKSVDGALRRAREKLRRAFS